MDQASWSTICLQLQGKEVMVWTRGGHFYRGFMKGWNDAGYVVVERASCPFAGNERGSATGSSSWGRTSTPSRRAYRRPSPFRDSSLRLAMVSWGL